MSYDQNNVPLIVLSISYSVFVRFGRSMACLNADEDENLDLYPYPRAPVTKARAGDSNQCHSLSWPLLPPASRVPFAALLPFPVLASDISTCKYPSLAFVVCPNLF